MKEKMMNIINAHNQVVKAVETSTVTINLGQKMALMSIYDKFTTEALEIVRAAKTAGIDCKANMQTGEIILSK